MVDPVSEPEPTAEEIAQICLYIHEEEWLAEPSSEILLDALKVCESAQVPPPEWLVIALFNVLRYSQDNERKKAERTTKHRERFYFVRWLMEAKGYTLEEACAHVSEYAVDLNGNRVTEEAIRKSYQRWNRIYTKIAGPGYPYPRFPHRHFSGKK